MEGPPQEGCCPHRWMLLSCWSLVVPSALASDRASLVKGTQQAHPRRARIVPLKCGIVTRAAEETFELLAYSAE